MSKNYISVLIHIRFLKSILLMFLISSVYRRMGDDLK